MDLISFEKLRPFVFAMLLLKTEGLEDLGLLLDNLWVIRWLIVDLTENI